MTHALARLEDDHTTIKKVLRALDGICQRLEQGSAVDAVVPHQVVDFFREFADRNHHGKEEAYLFPALEKCGLPREAGPIGVMLHEHETGRGLVGEMSTAAAEYGSGVAGAGTRYADAGRRFIEHLTRHIEKEEGVLFPMAADLLDRRTLESMTEWFRQVEDGEIGVLKISEYKHFAAAIESAWSC